ncbi:MAG: AraC family transcriptional regulator [Bacteroidota bacterium]
MRPEYEVIIEKPEKSFTAKVVRRENRPLLRQAWHFHPEIEICFTRKSHGKRFVGNTISNYQKGDLVLLGSNLPHGFTTEMECEQVVIQMEPDFLGIGFFEKPELRPVKSLLERAKQGINFGKGTKKKITPLVEDLLAAEGLLQMIKLLDLLNLLSIAEDYETICSQEYSLDLKTSHLNRIKIVYDFIIENFQKDVRVKEVADLLNLTEPAFFKFIKKQTKKTFTQIVNEFRIHHSTKLLMGTDKTISEISFESGYNNISYFNRKFREIMHLTPKEFRLAFDEKGLE